MRLSKMLSALRKSHRPYFNYMPWTELPLFSRQIVKGIEAWLFGFKSDDCVWIFQSDIVKEKEEKMENTIRKKV